MVTKKPGQESISSSSRRHILSSTLSIPIDLHQEGGCCHCCCSSSFRFFFFVFSFSSSSSSFIPLPISLSLSLVSRVYTLHTIAPSLGLSLFYVVSSFARRRMINRFPPFFFFLFSSFSTVVRFRLLLCLFLYTHTHTHLCVCI